MLPMLYVSNALRVHGLYDSHWFGTVMSQYAVEKYKAKRELENTHWSQ